jgi:hypothetical protein
MKVSIGRSQRPVASYLIHIYPVIIDAITDVFSPRLQLGNRFRPSMALQSTLLIVKLIWYYSNLHSVWIQSELLSCT